jgi:PAS domain S-box-containing protein
MADAAQSAMPDTRLFRDVFNASPIGIVVENLDGQPLFVNPAFCSMLGFSEQELRNKHCVDFSPPEDAEKDWGLFQQLRAGSIDHYQLEKRYFRRDGSLVWGRLSLSLLNGRSSPLVIAMVEDISDKKKAEEALLRHAAVVESSDDAIAAGTLDGIIVSWNTAAQKIYGYTEAEAIGKPINMLAPPELPDEENKILEILKAGGRIEHFETVRVTKTGKRINVSLTISPIKDSSGRTVGCSGIARDITERKRAEETLRESEERLRLAVQAGKMYAYDWDVATDVVVRSEESTNVLGPTDEPTSLTRQQLLAKVHPDDRPRFIGAVDDLTPENPTTHITYRVIRADGSVIWLEKHGRAFFNPQGKMLRMIGMVADVTERKRAEEALRASEERLRLAQQAAHIGSFEWNVQTGANTWTPELEAMYGLKPGGFAQTQEAFENLIHPEDRARVRELAVCTVKTGQPTNGEWRVLWPDGSIHWITGRWQVFMNESGEPSRMLGVNMDITERKRAEEALAGMSRKLIEAQEQERARIGRELHDDINQQLAMLAVELEQLQGNPSEIQNRVQELRRQTAEISNDVQALSHELHSAKVAYLGVVGGIKSWCKEFAERQSVEIDFKSDVSSTLPPEIGLSLFRVLQEAIHNAVKHSGVRRVEVQLRENWGEVHLVIIDSGRGFDVEEAMQGTGLGLTSMRERVRLMNGTITLDSKEMHGTSIHVRVPFRSDDASQRAVG